MKKIKKNQIQILSVYEYSDIYAKISGGSCNCWCYKNPDSIISERNTPISKKATFPSCLEGVVDLGVADSFDTPRVVFSRVGIKLLRTIIVDEAANMSIPLGEVEDGTCEIRCSSENMLMAFCL